MNDLVPTTVQLPAHLANRLQNSNLGQSISGGLSTGAAHPRISIKGSRFRIVEGSAETVLDATTLPVIVVGANPRLSKAYYARSWDPDAEPAAPECFSLDGVAPDVQATEPQNDVCATCQWNAWGSKITPTGTKVKACSDKKRLAVVAATDPGGTIYLLEVTPAALAALGKYQKELSMRGIPAEVVWTKVSFDTDASFPKLKFSFGGFLDEAAMEAVEPLFGSSQVQEITGELNTTKPAALPPPAKEKGWMDSPAGLRDNPPAVAPPAQPPAPARGFGKAAPAAPPAQPQAPARGFGKAAPAAPPAPARGFTKQMPVQPVTDGEPAAPRRRGRPPKVAATTPVANEAASLADSIADLLADNGDDDNG